MLNAMTNDPDVLVIKVDEANDDADMTSSGGAMMDEQTTKKDEPKKEEVKIETKSASTVTGKIATDFSTKSFGNFSWTDQDQNSKYSFLGDGMLTVNVATDEQWDPNNGVKKSPRVELADVKGDFIVEAKVKVDWKKYYHSGFGLCIHNGKQNIHTRIDYNGSYVYLEGYANDIDVPRTERGIEAMKNFGFLKFVRKGYRFSAYYSTVDGDWVEIESIESEFPESGNVGLYLFNYEGSTVPMKVEYVRLTQ